MRDHLPCAAFPTLVIEGLRVDRPGKGDTPGYALRIDRFSVGRGARIGLIGDSGSGKTTFLELIGLLDWPDAVVRFDFAPSGTPIDLCPDFAARRIDRISGLRARSIGFVLQDGGLLPYLTVRENAVLARALAGRRSDGSTIKTLAEDMGMAPYLDFRQSALSGGQRQRAALLRALAAEAPFLLADEPTASLDPRTSEAVMAAITRSVDARGATLVVASHHEAMLRAFDFEIRRIAVTESDGCRRAALVPA